MLNLNLQFFELLVDRGSLTEKFQQLMGNPPELTRLEQGHRFVSSQERLMLSIKPRKMALIREIKMGTGQQNWLFARTVIPLPTLKGTARRISNLNDTPIGKILFGRHGARRTQMTLSLTDELPNTVIKMGIVSERALWQRQSIFEFSSGPLMVTELFLPDCPIYAR